MAIANVQRHITYMNRHVKIIRLKGIGHVSKRSEIVVPAGLLEAKSDRRFATFLGENTT